MIELTLGALAAALVAKALDRAEGRALDQGEGVLKRLVELVRRQPADDGEDSTALERVENAPDSPKRVAALAHLLDARAASEPEFRAKLEALVAEAGKAGVGIQSIAQTAYGDQNSQFANISDSEISIYGDAADARRPRRISD